MKTVALISGGKDSCFSLMHAEANSHQIIALANIYPPSQKTEIDSYMFQTVGHEIIQSYSELLNLPLFRREITGGSIELERNYIKNSNDEVEDLYELLKTVKDKYSELEAVCCGAILSNYQRVRVEDVCSRLGLTMVAYLWERDQEELMNQMCLFNVDSVLIKVCSIGLKERHLGMSLKNIKDELIDLNIKYGVHVCGEGGEYETLTLDCPAFVKKLEL
jgi:diphthine-ammonia ligase